MNDKIALITGANKGIGYATAQGLGEAGVTVLVGARSPERGEAAAARLRAEGHDAAFVRLDVTDAATVTAAARHVEEAYGKLDILVNNAGIALADGGWSTSELTLATARKVFETNVFGAIAVTNAFLPLLHRSEAGRIVNVSSEIGSIGTMLREDLPFGGQQPGAYGASKAALNMLTVSYGIELKDTAIKINAVTPGFTATDLNGNQGTRKVEEGAKIAIDMALIGEDGPTASFMSDGRIDYLNGAIVPW
ncbi:SDR family NAD(P)-dependent oxidoreductase [Glycomyces tenuis]|uniref:SDR family NAD(P)-dependent oxidoreductase n=1 Tax=Glycomyces tenuis TaxID=58116 RepID=UPI000401C33C|nr:SDR family NAD(P)-dependent oxidoreductase [Glycomyces tenuis]